MWEYPCLLITWYYFVGEMCLYFGGCAGHVPTINKEEKKRKNRGKGKVGSICFNLFHLFHLFHFGHGFLRMLTWNFHTSVFSLYKMVNGHLVIQTEEFWLESVFIIYVSKKKSYFFALVWQTRQIIKCFCTIFFVRLARRSADDAVVGVQ